jgi:hypothetical protein
MNNLYEHERLTDVKTRVTIEHIRSTFMSNASIAKNDACYNMPYPQWQTNERTKETHAPSIIG